MQKTIYGFWELSLINYFSYACCIVWPMTMICTYFIIPYMHGLQFGAPFLILADPDRWLTHKETKSTINTSRWETQYLSIYTYIPNFNLDENPSTFVPASKWALNIDTRCIWYGKPITPWASFSACVSRKIQTIEVTVDTSSLPTEDSIGQKPLQHCFMLSLVFHLSITSLLW